MGIFVCCFGLVVVVVFLLFVVFFVCVFVVFVVVVVRWGVKRGSWVK